MGEEAEGGRAGRVFPQYLVMRAFALFGKIPNLETSTAWEHNGI